MLDMKMYEEKLENQMIAYKDVKKFAQKDMPNKLYRYRKFDKNYKSNIMEGHVYLSLPNAYNDPFDSAVSFDYEKCLETILGKESLNRMLNAKINIKDLFKKHYEQTYKRFRENAKIACFSEVNDSILMWSHYADNHSGFCIEYDTRKSSLFKELALPVIYKQERYNATKCLLTKNPNIALNPIMYKDISWSYEKEWRLWGTIDYFKNKLDFLDLSNAITGIYLGACIKEKDKDKMNEIKKWAAQHNVIIYNMELDDSSYKLHAVKTY